MSYPNELRYPQNRAGLYAESNCYSGLIVNVTHSPTYRSLHWPI